MTHAFALGTPIVEHGDQVGLTPTEITHTSSLNSGEHYKRRLVDYDGECDTDAIAVW